MTNGKIRHKNHLIDEQAIRFVKNLFPVEWVTRVPDPDYGIDIQLELFDYEDDVCVTLGEHIFLQVKGTEIPEYGTICPFNKKGNTEAIRVLKYSIDVPELNLVERMGSALPVLLIVVDLTSQRAYSICLNDYIKKVLPKQKPNYKSQKTVTIYIPVSNVIDPKNLNDFRWYGKRAKLYALFHEMLTDVDDFHYKGYEEIVLACQKFIERHLSNDAWNVRSLWTPMEHLYNIMIELKNNNMVLDSQKRFVQCISGSDTDWEHVFVDFNGTEMPAFNALQNASISHLRERVVTYSKLFEEITREWFLPLSL